MTLVADVDIAALASGSVNGVAQLSVPVAELESVVHQLATTQAVRFADLFAEDHVLRSVWALDSLGCYLVVETGIDGDEYPALSDIAPAAFVEECEIYEQFALRPHSGKPLNRVAIPPHEPDLPRLGRAPSHPPGDIYATHSVGGHAFEFPFGPVRAAGVESLYYGLVTSGEEIVDLYLFTWHKHRGVEWRLRGLTPDRALFAVERIEGLSAVANGWAFAAAVEHTLGIQPSTAALCTRVIALELERLYNHAAAIAALCQTTGLSVGQANAEIALERLLRVNAAVFGHRYLFGITAVGGAAKTPNLGALRRGLPGAVGELRRVTRALSKTNSFLDRLEATGILTFDQARTLGLVGPVARACGIDIDARRDHSVSPPAPSVAVCSSGDVLARYQIFVAEIEESARLLSDMVDAGADLAGVVSGGGTGLGWAESPRGETLCWLRLDDAGRVARVRLRPAAVRNWRAFDEAARSQNVFTDIPIIEASFWLTAAGMAR